MTNLILLVACFLFGMLLRRSGRLPDSAPAAFNSFIIHISLPALTLLYIHEIHPEPAFAYAAAMAWLHFGLGAGFFWAMGRVLHLPRPTVGALMLTGGLGNTSFFGLPMIETFYGHEGLATGIIADQLGSFLTLSTLGIVTAGLYSSGAPDARAILRKIVLFPPFIALVAALLLIPFDYPAWAMGVLKRLGDTLAPLALVSVGFQLRLGHLAGNGRNLMLGLVFKLLIAPFSLYLLLTGVFGAKGLVAQVTLFEAAMPPMITAAIIAAEHDLDPQLANLMVAVGIVLSFFTLTGWWWALRGI
ncbi:MAG TPA: AEC family transporter [Sulfuricella sp.]|nr:AEC family transporter [Sulfuricella sp.]